MRDVNCPNLEYLAGATLPEKNGQNANNYFIFVQELLLIIINENETRVDDRPI